MSFLLTRIVIPAAAVLKNRDKENNNNSSIYRSVSARMKLEKNNGRSHETDRGEENMIFRNVDHSRVTSFAGENAQGRLVDTVDSDQSRFRCDVQLASPPSRCLLVARFEFATALAAIRFRVNALNSIRLLSWHLSNFSARYLNVDTDEYWKHTSLSERTRR